MKNKHYLYILFCAVSVIANANNFDLISRIALGMTGITLLIDVISQLRRINHAK